jgi:serine/threonine-protein kinase RIO1
LKVKKGDLAVSDVAYNSFNKKLKNSMKRGTVKGVAAHGTGRAEKMDAGRTRGGAMDGNVVLLISKAVTNGLIQHCNGVVKEGKEAIVYHADGNSEIDSQGGGFDVAVKVFKRIQEFKGRGAYIDGDSRYHGRKFRNVDKREQVELWTEKEYRNLIRANRAGVPVPTPLMQKENVLFMRFLGEGGWPVPQLREIELKKRSKKWTSKWKTRWLITCISTLFFLFIHFDHNLSCINAALYIQTMVAVRKLYHCAKLIHADLSEYNILVSPMSQVENALDNSTEAKDSLQIVLIDFGQAVEIRHPSAGELLLRDLKMVKAFFDKQDVTTLSVEESERFVLKEVDNSMEESKMSEENLGDVNLKCGNDGDVEVKEDSDIADYIGTDDTELEENCDIANKGKNKIHIWDDLKDMEWIESKLIELSSKASS